MANLRYYSFCAKQHHTKYFPYPPGTLLPQLRRMPAGQSTGRRTGKNDKTISKIYKISKKIEHFKIKLLILQNYLT